MVGEFGFYTKIELMAELHEEGSLFIDFGIYKNSEWRNSIEFGIEYFFEHYNLGMMNSFRISLLGLQTIIVDTKKIVVVYSTIMCLSEMFKFEIDGLTIDNLGRICMSK